MIPGVLGTVRQQQRPGRLGSLPAHGRRFPVGGRPLAVMLLVAVRGQRQALVRDGTAFVRLGRGQEALNAAGECPLCRGLGRGRVILGSCVTSAAARQRD